MIDLTITEDQRSAVAFSLLCEIDSLREGYEAHEPEVQEAIRHLQAVKNQLDRLGSRRPA